MNKIRLLSPEEIACIAAGEVVEGPASIFKELVENAIDAKSTEIIIKYNNAGLDSIIVSDNGCGVAKDDMQSMFMLHATSKLSSINDLYYKNCLFGFRGEALAAISGVSKTCVVSRQKGAECAYSLIYDHGKQDGSIFPVSHNIGTLVTVTDLFEKVPARKRYMASIKTLERDIKYVLNSMIIMHPNITFSIYKDNVLENQYYVESTILDRMYLLGGKDRDKFIPIFYSDIYVTIEGLISISEHGWYDKSKIFLFVNNRIVKQQKLINRCVKPYYAENFIKRYPELYLHITVSPDQVDVNVHPRKEEVLFVYQKKIESILESVIAKTLSERSRSLLKMVSVNDLVQSDEFCMHENNVISKIQKEEKKEINIDNKELIYKFENDFKNKNNVFDSVNLALKSDFCFVKNNEPGQLNQVKKNQENVYNEKSNGSKEYSSQKETPTQSNLFYSVEFDRSKIEKENLFGNYIGILDRTYILLLKEKSIVCIDQHALHEKILYERYSSNFDESDWISHQLLIPFILKKKNNEIECIKKYEEIFFSCGFLIEFIEETIIIKGMPYIFFDKYEDCLGIVLDVIIQQENDLSSDKVKKLLMHEIIASKACRNAVKAGDALDCDMVNMLLKQIENYDVSFCPHGRPIYYEITTDILAKLCKRK